MKDPRIPLSGVALSLIVCAFVAGCGGGASTSPAPTPITPPPTSSTATLSGQWQIVAHSNVNPASSILVEANFSQNDSKVTADKSSVVLIEGVPGAFTGLSGECDNGTLGDDSVAASISGQTVSYTLTEAGSLGTGTSTGSATISADGTQIGSGTYQTPAVCGFAADSGSLTGTPIKPFSGTFAGQLLNFIGTTDTVVVTVSQSGYTLSAVGTDAGAPISLTGKVIGATFDVTGVVQGQSREYVGVYDAKSNGFLVYDSQFQALGTLTAQPSAPTPNPIAVGVTPSSATVKTGGQQTFSAGVANDPANKGVTWSLSCAIANGCGSISATTSASGTPITYTAPATPSTVTLTATSVTDATKSSSAAINVTGAAAVTVILSLTTETLLPSETTNFSATVLNDSSAKGVSWTLSGAGCAASTCGTLSSQASASGAAITYTAPSTAPSPPTVTLTATSIADPTKSAGATISFSSSPATVATVTVTCSPATVATASTSACSAVVSGANSPSQAITWTASAGTISPSGVLIPPAVTTQMQVTVTATSVADGTKSGTFLVTVNPRVPLNTPVFIGSGILGGLSIDGADARIAVNDIEVYLVTNGTSVALPGHAVSMQGADTVSFDDADNATYFDGAIQNEVLTDLPPTLYQGAPAWFDLGGNVQTPAGMIFSGDGTQDGINLQANGSLLTWVEETLPGGTVCQVWASVAGGQPQQITNVSYCAAGQQPLDVGNGHLFILWSGVNVAESIDNGATWTVGFPTNSQALEGVAAGGPNFDAPSAGATNIAYGDGTTYIVWQQRGDPNTTDDVTQCWLSKSTVAGQWSDAELLYPGTFARVGDFTPVVAGDGSDALFSLEQGDAGIVLNSTLLVSNATNGPLIGLLPNGTRIVAWEDAAGVWFEEVPK
jgi:hypothetical protein